MKLIHEEVSCCAECPYYAWETKGDEHCKLNPNEDEDDETFKIHNDGIIQPWCPLPDED